MQIDLANKIKIRTSFTVKIIIFVMTLIPLLSWKSTQIKAEYLCSYRTWVSGDNLYFQMVNYPELWNYTHIYFDTNSTEPTSASNDNESLWNLGTWSDYNSNWESKWCGIRSGTGYDMGCNTNNWPATMPNPTWAFTGATKISRVYIAVGDDRSNTDCSLTTSTPSPSPSPSPAPSPTPTPLPVSKVFFVPGFGASWNADAILNCKKTDYQGNWDLASYAEDIYNPILTALNSSGWDTRPFYYDWRKQVPENTASLASFINKSSIVENEKVDMVGHSMGGLLGNEYLKSADGNKLQNLLTLGTPFKGSALAYPPWAGGDVWNDNFLAKIAITIYLKHCGGLFTNDRLTIQNNVPSVQNLLPTEVYLQKIKTSSLYLPSHTINQNNVLGNSFPNPWGARFGTIAGTGFSTLNIIQTKEASTKELNNGNWLDGKPNGKLYMTEGDGTVLASSATLSEASSSSTLYQTHTGLVGSSDGITKILEFLGTPPATTQNSTYIEPNSALVLIGYPGNFWLTDENGNNQKDKNGMASVINPKSGSYKINLIPQSGSTLFIIAQFLPNGQTLYKEYNFEGYAPRLKTLKFDLQNPKEDIVN